MSRKDFILIAAVLKQANLDSSGDMGEIIEDLAERFAAALTSTNPNFDRDRFIKACLGE